MKLNTNSNVYTIVYSIVVVVIVAFLLAFCYSALKSRSEANERIDKKQQILAALNIRNVSKEQVEEKYKEVVVADEIITSQGNILKDGTQKDKDGFTVSRKDMSKDNLPIYICKVNGETKYVLPMVGKGLWGPIWGFIALNKDKKTVFGTYFDHESETAGLGSRIKDEDFQNAFQKKQAYSDNGEITLQVVKAGAASDKTTQCDGITGATLTTNGVENMIKEWAFTKPSYKITTSNGQLIFKRESQSILRTFKLEQPDLNTGLGYLFCTCCHRAAGTCYSNGLICYGDHCIQQRNYFTDTQNYPESHSYHHSARCRSRIGYHREYDSESLRL